MIESCRFVQKVRDALVCLFEVLIARLGLCFLMLMKEAKLLLLVCNPLAFLLSPQPLDFSCCACLFTLHRR